MPRFSDVFVYETIEDRGNGTYIFKMCRLIKKVDTFERHSAFEEITFDMVGMYLMLGTNGPYCLTTVV